MDKKKRSAEKKAAEKVYSKRKAVFERLQIIIILSVIFFVGLCLAILTRPTVSLIEKRELAKKPELTAESYFSGQFASEFTAYFSDTVPFREQLVEMSSALNKLKGMSSPTFYGNVAVVADDDGNSVDASPAVTEATEHIIQNGTEMTTAPSETASPEDDNASEETTVTTEQTTVPAPEEEEEEFNGNIAEFTNNGIIVDGVKMYGDNAGVMLFGGNNTAGKRYADIISKYKLALGDDVNVYNMVVPTSVEFYLPKKFRKYSSSEKDSIDFIYNNYSADIIPVDAYSEIAAHTDEYIYLRTDHHWSQRGAYYAYAALVKAMGGTPLDIDKDYTMKTKDGFVGSLYNYTNDITLKNSPEIFTYYMPKSEYTTYYYDYDTLAPKGAGTLFFESASGGNCYGMFIGADAVHTKIVTKLETGRKICVFKESYGNALVPYLVDSFDEVYVIDIRYFGRNAVQYIKDNGITDVLFINNAFAANTDKLIAGIENLYTYPYGTLDAEKIAKVEQYLGIATTTEATTVTEAVPAQTEAPVTEPAAETAAVTAIPTAPAEPVQTKVTKKQTQ